MFEVPTAVAQDMRRTVIDTAHGTRRCLDERCAGHAGVPVACEVRTRYRTQRIGHGPVTISASEQVPLVLADEPCRVCGGETEISSLATEDIAGSHHEVRWPVPHISPGETADETLPGPPPPRTLEARVIDLERKVAALEERP